MEFPVSSSSFAGKVVIVTGAGKGLGRHVALAFAKEGARLVLNGRQTAALDAVADELRSTGAQAENVVGDIAQSQTWVAIVAVAKRRFGRVDCLVNNAGIMGAGLRLCEVPEDEFDAVMSINVRGTWLGMKHCIPVMLETGGGAIVNLSSIHGLHGNVGQAAYSASKHAVIGLTKTAAVEYAKAGIRVNAVCPAAHETEMFADFRSRFTDAEWAARINAKYPLGRVGRPEEVSSVILFLCSPGASNLHGLAIPIDGGYAAQ
jgi:NAD(P)-dependent dehydrogenase (short-subunit alcohol dehydrogenase family)